MAEGETSTNLTMGMLIGFYATCVKHLARRVSEDGGRDFMIGLAIALCTGIAAFLFRNQDWLNALIVAVAGLVLWLWMVAIVHSAKVPVLIHISPETEARARSESTKLELAGALILLFLVLVPTGATWWWCSGRSLEREPKESLRHKTKEMADTALHYLEERVAQHPPFAYPDSRDANPTDEQRQKIAVCQKYDGETWNYYHDNFMAQMVAIVKEYKARGVDTGFLETGLTQHLPWFGAPGVVSIADAECMQDLCKFKELEYHVDAKDARIDIP